jgi:heptaprenyl diphosphate synthase
MYLCYRYTKLSVIGVSVMGSISHSVGQIIVALVVLNIPNIIFYLPYLLVISVPTGIIIGMISNKVIYYYKKIDNK